MHRSVEGDIAEPVAVTAPTGAGVGEETIAAISTPTGEGAIAVVRLSGPAAVGVAGQIFRGSENPETFESHTQHFGEIVDDGRVVDQAVVSIHRSPRSYTGEDVVEISCHGGILVTARVLEACLRAGARAARPGEFTERAFLNGKLDLTQAEAVMDLIRARSDLALRSAQEQLEGRLGEAVRAIREDLVGMLAHLEASIDFPEEGIQPDEGVRLRTRLEEAMEKMQNLVSTAGQGRVLREGVRAVIYGPTNAGKSSLLNCLLGYPRAIVDEKPGTTRDTIEEVVNLRGIPIRIRDTAGIRESADTVEREGIARATKSLAGADLILHVADRTVARPLESNDDEEDNRRILLLNKSDLPEHPDWKGSDALRICCLSGNGMGGLEEMILDRISRQHLKPESGVAINARHQDCLRRALASCELARATLADGLTPEYVTVDLRAALAAVDEITGAANPEDVRDALFAQFCIGK
jgi:tRNA modification GTPase